MKIFKKAAALFVAAAISITTALSAFAQASDSPKTENTIDFFAEQYTPVDKSKLVKWDPSVKPADNTIYYIDSEVKVPKDTVISVPQTTMFYLCEGANLQIYADAKFYLYGNMIIEPRARLTVSGMVNFKETSSVANYGTLVSTSSGTVKFSSNFINHQKASAILSGTINIFLRGHLQNRGTVTFAPNSEAFLTGSITNNENARLFVKGKLSTTLSGNATMNGTFSLLGEYVNSGTLTLEKDVKFYRGASSVLSASKSSRIIDNRQDASLELDEDLRNKGIKGIDVSSWQEIINWRKVKNAGIKFAMIRSSFSTKVDKTFEYNIVEAAKAGIDVGVYHYCYALNAEEAREEAKHFIKTISPYKITYPVVLDFEDNSQVKLDKEVKNEIAQVFIEEVRKAGYYPMIYSFTNWYENYMDMKALDCEVWVAHWNVPKPSYKGTYGMWQYSSEGKVSGIDVVVDLNVCFKDYAKIIRDGGYNNLDKFD